MRNTFKTTFATLISSIVAFFMLVSCKPNNNDNSIDRTDLACVVLIAENWYEVKSHNQIESENGSLNVAYLKKGESVTFEIELANHYVLSGVDYVNASFENQNSNSYKLILTDVSNSVRVTLSAYYSESDDPFGPTTVRKITYDANGGNYLQNNKTQLFTTEHHPRPNVSLGVNLVEKEGYTLIGWNSKQDCTGIHVGLGSRYIDEEQPNFTLYAEWVKNTPVSSLRYTYANELKDSLTINKYLGDDTVVCIPQSIDGLPVSAIEQNAFVNCEKLITVILPSSMEKVKNGAFINCAITDLFIYDNITSISDNSFVNCNDFSTVHINSIVGGKYVSADKHAPYADKIDRLFLDRNKKKIVILGGSSPYYSVDACRLKEIYPEYEPVNIAINGWFNGVMQFEIMEHFLGEGDVFMHICESRGTYQFMNTIDMGAESSSTIYDYRYFGALELNFDLIALADIRNVTRFFDVFSIFNNARLKKDTEPYTNYTNFADERGDFSSDPKIRVKAKPIREGTITGEAYVTCKAFSEEGFVRLNNHYDIIKSKGARIFFGCAPVNKNGVNPDELLEDNLTLYMNSIKNALGSKVKFINDIHDVLFPIEDFSDSDWHLDYDHAITFTNALSTKMGNF